MIIASVTTYAKSNYEQADFTMESGEKMAIVMVHFGSTHEDTRAKTIEQLNRRVADEFPEAKVVEAYTSRIIIRRLKERGIEKATPAEMLKMLADEGYTHVIVQASHIIEGVEMESLRIEVRESSAKFKDIRVGSPLLYSPEDYTKTIEALKSRVPSKTDAIVLVGHGTYKPITASYAMMDYMLKDCGMSGWHVGTIEGYPTFDNIAERLKRSRAKSVTLLPFMFVSGEHAKKDIQGEWREELEGMGYKVNLFMEGMGENPAIQQIFIDHIHFAMHNRAFDIMVKKEEYLEGRR